LGAAPYGGGRALSRLIGRLEPASLPVAKAALPAANKTPGRAASGGQVERGVGLRGNHLPRPRGKRGGQETTKTASPGDAAAVRGIMGMETGRRSRTLTQFHPPLAGDRPGCQRIPAVRFMASQSSEASEPPPSVMREAMSPALARIAASMAAAVSGLFLRKVLALSRPWPMRSPL